MLHVLVRPSALPMMLDEVFKVSSALLLRPVRQNVLYHIAIRLFVQRYDTLKCNTVFY